MSRRTIARSMATILALCLVDSLRARLAAAEYAPPPPIVQGVAPAPELPPIEYIRRPFELSPELSLAFPNCSDGGVDGARCEGLAAGPGLGTTLLWRPSVYFAVGGTLSEQGFALRPNSSSGLAHGRAAAHFFGLLGRLYFLDHGATEPYLELAWGEGQLDTGAREAQGEYDEASSGMAVRAGAGLEFYLGRQIRLGPTFDWTRFSVHRMQRCGASRCVDLDPAASSHGTGFTSVSLRLSLLLGPGL